MMKTIKKIIGWSFRDKVSAIAFTVILLIGLGFLLALTRYTIPYYDDYEYARMAKNSMSSSHDIIGAIGGAAQETKYMWYAWQGTHSSIFFMGLMPAIWGEQCYWMGPAFLILILAISVFVLTGVVARDVLKADRWNTLSLQSLSAGMVILYIYAAAQAFYWYNSGVHYTAMHSFMLLFVACIVHILYEKKLKWKIVLSVAATVLGVIVGGSNFVTALQTGLIFASVAVIGLIVKKKAEKKLLLYYVPALIAYAISFYYNVSAPGNNVREANFWYVEHSATKSVIGSFKEAFRMCKDFSNWKTMLILVLLVPVIWRIVRNTKYVFRWWIMLLIMGWTVCFIAAGFTPSLYATGEIVLARVINVIKIDYHLLLIVNEVYVLGFIFQLIKGVADQKAEAGRKTVNPLAKWKGGMVWPVIIVWMAAFFFFYTNEIDPIGSYSVFGACYYIFEGQAAEFHEQYEKRIEVLKNSDETDIVFEPYTVRPWFLINSDISTDPEAEQNVAMAKYYGKNSVRLKE